MQNKAENTAAEVTCSWARAVITSDGGHFVVADGWRGASNPHPHSNSPLTLKHTQYVSKRLVFPLFNSMTMDGRMDAPTEGWTD